MANRKSRISVRKIGVDYDGSSTIEIAGLLPQEQQQIEGMVNGTLWTRVVDGCLETESIYNPLPDKYDDPQLSLHFGREASEVEMPSQYQVFSGKPDFGGYYCSFLIRSLCGYYYTKDRYRGEAEKIEGWGFQCLRSMRGLNGMYWEIWYLPSLHFSEGELLLQVENVRREDFADHIAHEERKVEVAVDFIRNHAIFGEMHVTVQKLAMVMDD